MRCVRSRNPDRVKFTTMSLTMRGASCQGRSLVHNKCTSARANPPLRSRLVVHAFAEWKFVRTRLFHPSMYVGWEVDEGAAVCCGLHSMCCACRSRPATNSCECKSIKITIARHEIQLRPNLFSSSCTPHTRQVSDKEMQDVTAIYASLYM